MPTELPSPEPEMISVAELTRRIRAALQDQFCGVWVTGEISDLARPRSGHFYFTLKDQESQIAAVVWRGTATRWSITPEDGLRVACWGDVDVYPPRGSYQIIVRQMEPLGEGALQRALRQLQLKLAAEGLFEPGRKRPLPRFPRRIALVTSPSGAALHDFLEVAGRRWAGPELLVIPTRVQGAGAGNEIAAAIRAANQLRPIPDVVVVTRGGGSIEDLWCFNEEVVVRAIFGSQAPVVSAIGHEIDVTLSDLVADCRALTPSEAAERVIPSAVELRQNLDTARRRLVQGIETRLQQARARLLAVRQRPALARPTDRLRDLAARLDQCDLRLMRGVRLGLDRAREVAASRAARLEALSPLGVLARGYAIALEERSGQTVRSHADVVAGDRMVTRLADGMVQSIVESTEAIELVNGCLERRSS